MSETALINKWRDLLATGASGLQLVDAAHPLQIFVGALDTGAARLVIRTSLKPVTPTLSSVVLVDRYEDKTGKWNLSFTLQDMKFAEVFLRLADDVHARSVSSPNEAVALDRVGVVFSEWRRLLSARPTGILSMEELRGLVGELWLVLHEFADTRTVAAALEGWLGPMGLPQDFWFDGEGYSEVKAIGPSVPRVRISSEHQLDADDLDLIVLFVASTDESASGACNLPGLVNLVRSALAEAGDSADPLDDRLSRLGVEISEPFYRDSWFVVAEGAYFEVTPEFPRLRASTLPSGVSRLTYQLDLAEIEPYRHQQIKIG